MAGLVPAIPLLKSAEPLRIGITGTGPVMTEKMNSRPDFQEA
jgi:hypothetical protein